MINIPVSVGELLDKIVILRIKMERFVDLDKKQKCKEEYELLMKIAEENKCHYLKEVDDIQKENERLWNIENAIRQRTHDKCFDDEFVRLAQDSFRTNEARAKLKWKINKLADSEIVEQKEYVGYKESE